MAAGKCMEESRELCCEFNALAHDDERRGAVLKKLLPNVPGTSWVMNPFLCDCGANISAAGQVWINQGFIAVGPARITLGKNVYIGPNCIFETTVPPECPARRRPPVSAPIALGDDVWLGSDVKVVAGVTIGSGSVVGMGSVVTGDIPERVFAAGNPARVIRSLEDDVRFGR